MLRVHYRIMITKAGVAILRKIKGVWYALLVKQKLSGRWCFPKGSKNRTNESWQSCAKRELAEETGLFIDIPRDHRVVFIKDTAFFLYTPTYQHIRMFKTLVTNDSKEIEEIAWKPVILNETSIKHKIYHVSIEHIINNIEKQTFYELPIVKKNVLTQSCSRSKWIPTPFFKKTSQISTVCDNSKKFWR